MDKEFEYLRRKDIIAILDGDERLDGVPGSIMGMPYLSGYALCELSNSFGLHQDLGSSRWVYLDNLLRFVIDQDCCDDLLRYMFDLERFTQLGNLDSRDKVETMYQEIVNGVINHINAKLALAHHELRYIAGHFYITTVNQNVVIDSPQIDRIDAAYVRQLPDRCNEDLQMGNYDSVITKARTLIEEVLVFILEKKGEEILSKGDVTKLYAQVKSLFHMQQNKNYDGRVNSLLSGLEKIVDSIGSMRNANSDSHGVGKSRINVKE